MQQNLKNKENIWTIPTALNFSRVMFTFLAAYFIFADFHIFYIIATFLLAMFTDLLDGFMARKLNLQSELGGKFDMAADRFFMLGFFLVIVIKFSSMDFLTKSHLFQIFFIVLRDIITVSIGLFLISMREKAFPKVKFIGKLTTFMQTLTFPLILLSIFYPFFSFSIFFAIATGTIGLISSGHYIYDVKKMMEDKKGSRE